MGESGLEECDVFFFGFVDLFEVGDGFGGEVEGGEVGVGELLEVGVVEGFFKVFKSEGVGIYVRFNFFFNFCERVKFIIVGY